MRERLYRYATRHLPIADAVAGSMFVPPMHGLRTALGLNLELTLAARLSAASCLYFAAADVLDDVADGDVRVAIGQDLNDGCRLLFLHGLAVAELPVDDECARDLSRIYQGNGLVMATGQAWDLAGTDAPSSRDPMAIARHKSGAEYAACIAAPARVAGLDPTTWLSFGRTLGALVQVMTDYLDLFLDEVSDDWRTGKPTLPIRAALADPTLGARVRTAMAGERDRPRRRAQGRWLLVQAGAAAELVEVRARVAAEARDASAALDAPWLMAFHEELDELVGGIVEALDIYAADAAPGVVPLSSELKAWRRRLDAFWADDSSLDTTTERRRDGVLAGGLVEGDVYGRARVCALRPDFPGRKRVVRRVVKAAEGDGWRFYPGVGDTAPDWACSGLGLQLLAASRGRTRAGVAGAEALAAALVEAVEGDAVWCWASFSEALLGCARTLGAFPERAALVDALAAALSDPPESILYSRAGIDFCAVNALTAITPPEGRGAAVEAGLAAVVARWRPRRTLSGTFGGDVLHTAQIGTVLARLDALESPRATIRALVDGASVDGGYRPLKVRRTLPDDRGSWYRSARVVAAYAEAAVRQIDAE